VRELNADLLFCPFTAPTYFEPGIPTVSVIYDLQYKTYPEFFPEADVAQRDRTFVEASRRSTALVAISDYSRRVAIEHGHLDPAHIKTVHLHISQHSLRGAARDETILDRLKLVAGQYLIYPANFWKHKNHEMLLTAFGIARVAEAGRGRSRTWRPCYIPGLSRQCRTAGAGHQQCRRDLSIALRRIRPARH
jgi:hypothetical protein